MPTPTNENDNVLVIDDDVYRFLLDLGNQELGEDYRSFVNSVLSNKIIKKKFILLQGLQRKISRLDNMEGTLDLLCEHIKSNIHDMTPQESIKFYQTLSQVYDNDVKQLRRLFIELLKITVKS